MTFRQPPVTTTGMTGLGAVGGARGVGAQGIRVLVEFLTQYDAEKVKKLEADLQRINQLSQLSDARTTRANQARLKDEAQIAQIQKLKLTLSSDEAKRIKDLRDLARTQGREAFNNYNAQRKALSDISGLSAKEIDLLVNEDKIHARIAQREEKRRVALRAERARQTQFNRQQVVTERQLGSLQQLRASVLPKLGGLALGAVGGIVGGAILGVGFQAAEAALEGIGQILKDIFDPANRAREALKGVADQVNAIADEKGVTLLQAATEVLDQYGSAAEGISPAMLANATAVQAFVERNKELADIQEVVAHTEELRTQALVKAAQTYAKISNLTVNPAQRQRLFQAFQTLDPSILKTRTEQTLYNQALDLFGIAADEAATKAYNLARAQQQAAGTAQLAAYAENQLANALSDISNQRISGLQDQLSAISEAGPSARTQALTKALEDMAEAQAQNAYQSQLQQLQEERTLILLEQRIRFQGQSINLEQLSGKAALVAIDARISALQRAGQLEQAHVDALEASIKAARRADQEQDKRDKAVLDTFNQQIEAIRAEGQAQDRLNQLLEIQYRLSQQTRRQAGESIGDFLARRANEQRELLVQRDQALREQKIADIEEQRDQIAAIQEVANARREAQIEALELEQERAQAAVEAAQRARDAEIQALQDRRERTELQVRLEENAEQQKQVAAAETTRKKQKALQEELTKSQERDRKETESRRKAIEAQIEAERKRLENVLRWAKIEESTKLATAAFGARTYKDVQTLIGELSGASRALAELKAYAKANGIPVTLITGYEELQRSIRVTQSKIDSILRRTFGNIPQVPGFAKGGVLELSNSRSPFGQNVRLGEEGREIGVILSNRVARILQEQTRAPSVGQQTINVYRSDDAYRDADRFGRKVEDALSRMLR